LKDTQYIPMQNKTILTFCFILLFGHFISAQTVVKNDSVTTPEISYNEPKEYQIADIQVEGADAYEDFTLIGFSGLEVGQKITVPGDEITNAIKKFWEQSMFSDVKIEQTKVEGNKVWLTIHLQLRPKVSEIIYKGLKKSEIEDIEKRIGILKDKQITPNMSDRATKSIKKYLDEKGFSNADIKVYQKDDPAKPGYVKVDVDIDKKLKTKVHQIYISGNDKLNAKYINQAMKKTNDNNILNIFKTKKFVRDLYEKDKIAAVEKYNDFGYRDAYIVSDSVVKFDDKSVDVYLKFNEGSKYYFRNIKWIGNTIYPYEALNQVLGIKKGDIYNHKQLTDRLESDEDAVAKMYSNNGYLFFNIQPVEVAIENDSIDFEIRMNEGKPATINEVNITGNERVNENVVRRELRTVPGALYSQDDIVRTLRELSQLGHFDPEKLSSDMMKGGIKPNPESGTVDLNYHLETKSSDQVEFSAGWGAAGIVGSLGLKFSNFSIQNIFKPKTYRIVPQGEGQTLSIQARTNGNYYSSYSLSFLEPWLGGKRPNSLSVSLSYTTTSGMSNRYLESYQNMYSSSYSSYYGSSSYGNSSSYESEVDPNKYFRTIGGSVGYGKRLSWPDDFFTFYGELSYQRYMINNWYQQETSVTNGDFNNIGLNLTLGRNSIDNPIWTRKGSNFSLGLQITPPYSALNGKDYSDPNMTDAERYKFIEYHKWKFSSKIYTPLMSINKTPVLMTRTEFAYVGHFNKNARTPFGTYMFGGDGMSGYSGYANEYVSMRGYETGALTPYEYGINSAGETVTVAQRAYLYNKFTMELRVPISLEQSATIWALGFVEAGNSFNKISEYNPFKLKRSAGVGVRIYLPMFGIMGIDWAYGFDPQVNESKAHGSQLHFVIGQEL